LEANGAATIALCNLFSDYCPQLRMAGSEPAKAATSGKPKKPQKKLQCTPCGITFEKKEQKNLHKAVKCPHSKKKVCSPLGLTYYVKLLNDLIT